MKHIILILVFLTSIVSAKTVSDQQPMTGRTVSDFKLKNINGQLVSLSNYKKAKGFIIIFTCNHCPFAKLYSKRYNDLNAKYSKLNVPLIAINSMDTLLYEEEAFALMQQKSKDEQFNFPYLCDGTQSVGRNFNAQKTPHAYVIWKEKNQWKIKYNGALDDNGAEPDLVKENYVIDAIDALLQNKEVKTKEVTSFGCTIGYRKTKSVY